VSAAEVLELSPARLVGAGEEFDEDLARQVLADVEEAMRRWITSTVKLADMVYLTKRYQCWRVDEDYRAALASSAIALDTRGNHQLTWLGWKFNRAARSIRELGDYGYLRAIMSVDPNLPQLAEPEFVARPLRVLLRPKYTKSEEAELGEQHHDVIRSIWRQATERTGGDSAKAIPEAIKIAKKSDFAPIRRVFVRSMTQKREAREKLITATAKAFGKAGHDLIRLGATDQFDAVMAELAEARKRWRPT
jgi:hypothetical protein